MAPLKASKVRDEKVNFRDFRQAGHWPTLLAVFLYFDFSFMVWVTLGPLIIYIASDLNIGVEEIKGLDNIRQAASILKESQLPITFRGFVEGDDIGHGAADVIVTDGYTGNIALKTAEGTAKQIGEYLRAAMRRSLLARAGAILAQGAFRALKEKMDPRQLNGGIFLGLNGIVVKSHGGTDATGFASALDLAYDLASSGVVTRLADDITRFHVALELEGERPSVGSLTA